MENVDYSKGARRYEQKGWLTPITVKTQHQGYVLEMGDTEYMYYSVPKLLKGLAIHAGFGQEDFFTSEEMDQLLESILNGSAMKNALTKVAELKKVIKTLKKELKELRRQIDEK